ncbi:MAG TPA: tetratricopeptide repeat protein [Clostridia bacterium]|jgi:tetratricopeptide (TPR) repeat protein|nr:tetratricopeptide repeat protein [Clostridia bacterium]
MSIININDMIKKIKNSGINQLKNLYQSGFILKESIQATPKPHFQLSELSNFLDNIIIFNYNKDRVFNILQRRVEKNTSNYLDYFRLGLFMIDNNNLLEAQQYFKQSCLLKKDFSLGRYWLGRTYELLGDETEALIQYKIASELDPRNWRSWLKRAVFLIKKGMYELAYECGQNALATSKKNGELFGILACLAFRLNYHKEFIEFYSEALKFNIKDINIVIQLSNCMIKTENYEDALKLIEKNIKREPNNLILLNNKGYCLNMLNQHAQALSIYLKAHNINPMDTEIINNIGTTYLKMNNAYEAQKWYDIGLKIQPNAAMFNNKAVCLELLGQYEEAAIFYRKAANLEPHNPIYEKNHRLSLIKAHKYENVIDSCLKLFKTGNNIDADTYEEIGYCLYQLKKYDDALRMFYAGLALQPNNSILLTRIGLCLEKLNFKEEALSYYNAALKVEKSKKAI